MKSKGGGAAVAWNAFVCFFVGVFPCFLRLGSFRVFSSLTSGTVDNEVLGTGDDRNERIKNRSREKVVAKQILPGYCMIQMRKNEQR